MIINGARIVHRYKTLYYLHLTQQWIPGPNLMEHSMFTGGFLKAGIITDQITLEDHVVVIILFFNYSLTIQILENNQWKIGTVVE